MQLKSDLTDATKQNAGLAAVVEEKKHQLTALEVDKQAHLVLKLTGVEALLQKHAAAFEDWAEKIASLQTDHQKQFATLHTYLSQKSGDGVALQSNTIVREGGKKFRVMETDDSESGEDVHGVSFSEQEATILRDMRWALEKVCATLQNDPEFEAFRHPGLGYVGDRSIRKKCKKTVNHPMDLATVLDEVKRKVNSAVCNLHLICCTMC